MPSANSLKKSTNLVVLMMSVVLGIQQVEAEISVSDELSVSLKQLITNSEGSRQIEAQQAWKEIVDTASATELPAILATMKEVGPLTQNWLRAAADAVAERELAKSGQLPIQALEEFALNVEHAPRARRVAYEWLTKVDPKTPERLLPKMLDDPSLELRYDAVEQLLARAKSLEGNQNQQNVYEQALNAARDNTQIKQCVEALTELGQTPNLAKKFGFLAKWKVIGPFDNTDRAGFDKVYPPELAVDFAAEYAGKEGPVKWQDVAAEQEELDSLGTVDLNKALVEEKSVLAYATTTFVSTEDQQIECRYESKEATKLWVNGEEVAVKDVYHSGSGFDQYVIPCQFKQGENQILIKVCQNEQTEPWTRPWDFRLRVTDSLGGAIQPAQ